jgi:ASC-1-like (ASCH) protein
MIATLRMKNEINYNLKIIDMINWKHINIETKKHLANQLSTKALEEYIYLGRATIVEKLLNAKLKKINNTDLVDNDSLISHLINKIKTIHIISSFPENLENDNKGNFITRVNNITSSLDQLKKLT